MIQQTKLLFSNLSFHQVWNSEPDAFAWLVVHRIQDFNKSLEFTCKIYTFVEFGPHNFSELNQIPDMKKSFQSLALLLVSMSALAQSNAIEINSFRHAGPYAFTMPHLIDSVNIKGDAFNNNSILDSSMPFDALDNAVTVNAIPAAGKEALHLLGFNVENRIFTKAEVNIKGLKDYKLYLDGKKVQANDKLKLEPGTHEFVIKCISGPEGNDSLKVSVIPEKEGRLTMREDGKRIFSLDYNTDGISCGGVSISASGKYIKLGHRNIDNNGRNEYWYEIIQASDGRILARTRENVSWMPASDRYYYTRTEGNVRKLYSCDPASGEESLLCSGLPEGSFTIAPTEDFLIYSLVQKGPSEGDVHQILTPNDRQPGWRDRTYLAKYDLATGVLQQLTYGWHDTWLADISRDGRKLLFMTSRERLSQRPTQLSSVLEMDLESLEVKTIVKDDGFINAAQYSPDATQLLITGTAEAFNGVGKDVKPGQIPNGYDIQLFVLNIKDGKVNPITKKFNPSISTAVWSSADGKIYASTEDKDVQNLYRIDPKNGKAVWMKNSEEYLYAFDLADKAPVLVYYGQSLVNGDRAYCMDLKSGKETLLYDFDAERFGDVKMGEGLAYEFKSSRGDLINGFYVLPPDFDPSKKYPLIVHYYGGCSPTARYCYGSYSPQVYAAMGYICYVINPSGAAGFGQEFAARHVNTAGDVVSDDIIEGTLKFCEDHPYVDKEHIGCFSASYGGFMTQLLLSKTDIYATGISHAGISDHTSYWGEGYWGYSYSEVSMADNYPWTNKNLFVDHSTLFNADKIHTPLLFLHGSADTNVPIGESIQMFTALKILGNDTAFVVVDGENHGISDYAKRRQWLRTIFAWFSKYLQEDDSWWNELYPQKNL